jgi:hypothetical protein
MMRVNRRSVIAGLAVAAIAAALPAGVQRLTPGARLFIFDTGIAESRAFAKSVGGGPKLDLARERRTLWAGLRGRLPAAARVEGLTGWSDWISVRGELEARGFRLVRENPVKRASSRKADLFRWSMEARRA